MAQLGQTFDATQHDTEQRDYTPLPENDYNLEVTESDVVDTKSGQGLKLTYRVIDGEYEGRKIFGFINISNASAQAQEIGQKELASLCRAVERPMIEDSEELHFIAFSARVGLGKPSKEKNADGTPVHPAKNEIKRFYFPDDGAPAQARQAPAAANDNRPAARAAPAAASRPAAGARPWSTAKR